MGSKEKFHNLVEQKKFLEIETFLQTEHFDSNDEKINLWIDFINILEHQKISHINNYYSKVLVILIDQRPKSNSVLINFVLKIKKSYKLKLVEEIEFLSALWDEGYLKDFYQHANILLEKYLMSKNASRLMTVINFLEQKNNFWPRTKFFKLMVHSFQGNQDAMIESSNEIIILLEKNWKKVFSKKCSIQEYYQKIYNILATVEFKSARLELFIIFLKGLIFAKFAVVKYKLDKTEIIKLLIGFENEIDALIISLANSEKHLQNELKEYLKKTQGFSLSYVNSKFSFCKKFFSPQVKVKGFTTKTKQDNFNICKSIDIGGTKILKKEYSNQVQKNLDSNEMRLEKDFIEQIQSDNFKNVEAINDLVIAFYELDLLNVAVEFLKIQEMTLENRYLLCEILYKQKKYVEVISEVALLKIEVSELSIEFLYLEAESYLRINKNTIAKKLFKKILIIDPDFRQVRERILDA